MLARIAVALASLQLLASGVFARPSPLPPPHASDPCAISKPWSFAWPDTTQPGNGFISPFPRAVLQPDGTCVFAFAAGTYGSSVAASIFALDVATGKQIWNFAWNLPNNLGIGAFALSAQGTYCWGMNGDSDNGETDIAAISLTNGSSIWTASEPWPGTNVTSQVFPGWSMTVANDFPTPGAQALVGVNTVTFGDGPQSACAVEVFINDGVTGNQLLDFCLDPKDIPLSADWQTVIATYVSDRLLVIDPNDGGASSGGCGLLFVYNVVAVPCPSPPEGCLPFTLEFLHSVNVSAWTTMDSAPIVTGTNPLLIPAGDGWGATAVDLLTGREAWSAPEMLFVYGQDYLVVPPKSPQGKTVLIVADPAGDDPTSCITNVTAFAYDATSHGVLCQVVLNLGTGCGALGFPVAQLVGDGSRYAVLGMPLSVQFDLSDPCTPIAPPSPASSNGTLTSPDGSTINFQLCDDHSGNLCAVGHPPVAKQRHTHIQLE